jgi:hypothetical protein
MTKYTKTKIRLITLILLASVLILTTTTILTTTATTASTDWKLNLTFKANNETITNSTQPTFAPFDLIQLTANLTNANSTVPQSSVVFSVKGPSSASNPTEIVRSAETDKTGLANISFRIPSEEEEKVVIGKWQVFTNVKISNQTLIQNATFQVAWPVQNLSIDFKNSTGQSKTNFNPGETGKAIITYTSIPQPQNISLTIKDNIGNIITQETQQVTANATGNNLAFGFIVPQNSPDCLAQAELNIYSGKYQDHNIPAAENKTAYFSIGNYTTPLPNQTSPTPTSSPSPTPVPPVENTLSLFSWLLVATGFFTFTVLMLFLKRKTVKIGVQIPVQPSMAAMAKITTSDSTGVKVNETIAQTEVPSIIQQIENPMNATNTKLFNQESITTYLSRISISAQRIQDLKAVLNEETNRMNKEISELNETLQRQEEMIKNYFDNIKLAVKKAQDTPLDEQKENPQTQTGTENTQP